MDRRSGGGGNRIPVQKHSVDCSTRLAHVWILIRAHAVSQRARTSQSDIFCSSRPDHRDATYPALVTPDTRSSGRGPRRTPRD